MPNIKICKSSLSKIAKSFKQNESWNNIKLANKKAKNKQRQNTQIAIAKSVKSCKYFVYTKTKPVKS